MQCSKAASMSTSPQCAFTKLSRVFGFQSKTALALMHNKRLEDKREWFASLSLHYQCGKGWTTLNTGSSDPYGDHLLFIGVRSRDLNSASCLRVSARPLLSLNERCTVGDAYSVINKAEDPQKIFAKTLSRQAFQSSGGMQLP